MKIIVETGAWAARYTQRELTLDMPEKSTVADAVRAAKIPEDEAGIAVIDGKAVMGDYVLSDGDVLRIHPVIIGG